MQNALIVALFLFAVVAFIARRMIKNEDLEGGANIAGILSTMIALGLLFTRPAPGSDEPVSPGPASSLAPSSTPALPTDTLTPTLDLPTPTATLTSTATVTPTLTATATETVTSTATQPPIEINVTKSSSRPNRNVILTVETIEIRPNNRMRWFISFWNQTDKFVSMEFGWGERYSYLADEYGTRYDILSMEPSGFIASHVDASTKLSGWLEFELPTRDARNFKLYLEQQSFGLHQLYYEGPVEIYVPVSLSPLTQ
jgi:hypothetical protein